MEGRLDGKLERRRVDLDQVGGAGLSLGQKTKALSIPVTLASNEDALAVTQSGSWNVTIQEPLSIDDNGGSITVDGTIAATQSGTWNINNISGTISLPTGAATAAKQLADGHNVTVDNASGGSAVNIQDGGNSITVDQATHDNLNLNANMQIGNADVSTTNQVPVQGTAAKAAAISGNPLSIGLRDLAGQNEYAAGADLGGDICVQYVFPVDGGLTPVNYNSDGSTPVSGTVAHDAVDTQPPVKVGGYAIDMHPDTDAVQGRAEVAIADRVDGAFNLQGQAVDGVNSRYNVIDNVSTTYDDVTSTATSTAIECWNYRQMTFSYDLISASTPTDITFEVEVSLDGTNYTSLTNNALGSFIFDDTSCSTEIFESYTFPIAAQKVRIKATATGTDATNTFIVSNATIYLRN